MTREEPTETLGQRIRRIRKERGLSMAKVGGKDFTRAFLSQVELGKAQPSTRVLRLVAARLGTEVEYLLEGREAGIERELALEKGRVLLARGDPRRALLALRPALESRDWPLGTEARLCQAQAMRALGRIDDATRVLDNEKKVIWVHRDRQRMERVYAIERGEQPTIPDDPVQAHLELADRAQRQANGPDELEHYRAARVLLEAGVTGPRGT
ncbi:MAG: helix-turn-helix transcriptional regulator [Chloroflexi bacterium]|nr:MAG: helix-turn-helix transcriptional regulator [Chloroflexota bacterium]